MAKKKTWFEKLVNSKGLPKVQKMGGKMSERWGEGTMVIPTPMEVDEIMKKVPRGKLITINEIRIALAKKHKATIACPMTTGMFAWIDAHAAEEQRQKGANDFTPYWRTLKAGGVINEKYSGGVEGQRKLLEMEGHKVARKGKNYIVLNYEESLIKV
ncbi:MAG: MGMT family protein [Candidatus Bathyarchaeia archaeon]